MRSDKLVEAFHEPSSGGAVSAERRPLLFRFHTGSGLARSLIEDF